ncbi:MAG: transcriptional regulator, partial [Bacteroidales bacterium]|nr:transcriptional regulator [Bacteroidales bacterium]
LVHRNYLGAPTQIRVYDNKINFWNEGSLPEGLTVESLKGFHTSRPRNVLIADVCFKGGYIDSWGRGTLKIYNSCSEAKLPEPEIREFQGGLLVTLSKDNFTDEQLVNLGLNNRQLKAVNFVKEKRKITNKEYQEINGCSRNTASNDLGDLVQKNVFIGSDVKGAGAFYHLK